MTDALRWFMDDIGHLTNNQLECINQKHSEDYNVYSDDIELQEQFFKRMPYCNINSETHGIRFGKCATDLFKELFHEYGQDSLIITTYFEHDNVNKILNEHPNVYKIRYNSDLNELKKYILDKEYKKIFVYIIGTQISTGEIAPTSFLIRLKQILETINVEYIFTLDAVQEMFLIPRDYRIFDYIIGTGHSLVMKYDIGMVLYNRKNKEFGYVYNDLAKEYLKHLDIVLSKKDSLLYYKFAMKEMFKDVVDNKLFSIVKDSTPQIFSIRVDKSFKMPESIINKIKDYYIYFDGFDNDNADYSYIRIRWQQVIAEPEKIYNGILLLKRYLSELKEIANE